jgi:hypothetical protein
MATALKLFPAPAPTRTLLYDVDILRNGRLIRIMEEGLSKARAERLADLFNEMGNDGTGRVAVVTLHVQPTAAGGDE